MLHNKNMNNNIKLFLASSLLALTACGGSSSDSPDSPLPQYKVHDGNLYGVWRNGSNNFVSFSPEKYNSSLLTNTFIDEGDYTIKGDTIMVNNTYFNKTTKYVVNAINDTQLSVTITYKDPWNGTKTQTMQFKKTTESPCAKTHNLVGKSYYAQYNTNSGAQHWNKIFTSYNIMNSTREDVVKSAPATFYYVYLPPKLYFYVIRSGDFYYDTVRYGDVEFNENNQIESLGYLFGEKLY